MSNLFETMVAETDKIAAAKGLPPVDWSHGTASTGSFGDMASQAWVTVRPIAKIAAVAAVAIFAPEIIAATGMTGAAAGTAAAVVGGVAKTELTKDALQLAKGGDSSPSNPQSTSTTPNPVAATPAADASTTASYQAAAPGLSQAAINTYAAAGVSPASVAAMLAGGSSIDTLNSAASDASGGNTSTLSKILSAAGQILPAALALYGANQVKNLQQSPNQTVIDPVTGKAIASSTTDQYGTTTDLGAATSQLDTQATGGLTNVAAEQQKLYDAAGANQGGYVQAVVDPVRAAATQALSAQRESMGLRGLSGSSLADESLANTSSTGANAISSATAKALEASMGLQSGLATSQSGTATSQANLGNLIANQNLAAMGRGATGAAAGAVNQQAQTEAQARALSTVGTLASGISAAVPADLIAKGAKAVWNGAKGLYDYVVGPSTDPTTTVANPFSPDTPTDFSYADTSGPSQADMIAAQDAGMYA